MSALPPLTQIPSSVSPGQHSGPGPSTSISNGARSNSVSQTVPCEIAPPPPPLAPAPAARSGGSVKARPASCRTLPVSVSTQEIQTEASMASLASLASVNSLQSGEVEVEGESVNGDICKGGYGYRFDFRNSCEFDFTEDVYI